VDVETGLDGNIIPSTISDALTFDMLYRPGKGFGQSVIGCKQRVWVMDDLTGNAKRMQRQFIADHATDPDHVHMRDADRTFENEVRLHGTLGDLA
jgi:hypothetical protein